MMCYTTVMDMRDTMTSLMALQLAAPIFGFLKEAGKTAAERGEHLYLVGGAVRDLLLKRPVLDIDIVVEGDGPAMAAALAEQTGATVTVHREFGTATLKWGELSIDIVTARSEHYEAPGQLPKVIPGTMKDDLFRRDFSINAMAVSLDPDDFGELLDPHGGIADLKDKSIRVLHEKSFSDDPTRAWRAVRYEQRLGFYIEPGTLLLLERDLPLMDNVTGERIRHELELVLKEACPECTLLRADTLGLLKQADISPADVKRLPERFSLARERYGDHTSLPLLYMAVLCWPMPQDAIERIIGRMHFQKQTVETLRGLPYARDAEKELVIAGLQPSRIYFLLKSIKPIALMAATICMEAVAAEQVEAYLNVLRYVKPVLRGADMVRLGVPEGPQRSDILAALRNARLDGTATSKAEEEELLRRLIGENGAG